MRTVERIWPVLLAATFATAIWAAAAPAADLPGATAARPATTAVATPSKTVPMTTRHAKVAVELPRHRPVTIRLASRFTGPLFGYFPLYLGVAY